MTSAKNRHRDPVLRIASVPCLLAGTAGWWLMQGQINAGLPYVSVLWPGIGMAVATVLVICGVRMLLGSVAAAAVAVLVACPVALVTGVFALLFPVPQLVVPAAVSLLVVVPGVWAVFRVTPTRR